MNVLELIPGISGIIDKIIPDPNKQQELKLEMAKLDAQDTAARMGVLQAMLSNKSIFVAGAIPAIIWVFVFSLANNYILLPWARAFGATVPEVPLPDSVIALVGGIVAALLGKKYMDNNEFYYPNGQLKSPSKMLVEAAAAKGNATPVGAHNKTAETITIKSPSLKDVDLSNIDRRIEEEIKKRGIK